MNKRVEYYDNPAQDKAVCDQAAPIISSADSDKILVRKVQDGDSRAFDLLVIKHQHKVANLVSRWVKDHSEIQDATQDTFLSAYRGLHNFRGDSEFYTWLYRIAVNTAKGYVISATRRPTDGGTDAEIAENFIDATGLREVSDPYKELLTDKIAETIKGSIANLPEIQRTAIVLRELHGHTYEEIAQMMDCPIGTVRSRIFRARADIEQNIRPLIDNNYRAPVEDSPTTVQQS